ncbi:hypothetical protein [Opitutus terrae]|uniref:Uncharacterized protein n=1 Tax=Opitutus terrae (strain DSM 11246 / JCM 15787 / PB90-1) TaxID=452637 RepID=B1ZQA8_OPITP|nr:hypothetical protein [Opitutus terrae]ACB73588.1 hypothetical protein Oter_0298 [Opitutus terrae PB90-1]
MRKSSVCLTLLAALFGATAAVPAFASGSYAGRPPSPPAKSTSGMKLDRAKYGLGQKVYEGAAMTPGGGEADAQRPRLQAAQRKLPAEAMREKDLPALAGKLSDAQLEALEYFVEQRFPMKK